MYWKKLKWFTFIEILVVIWVFSIWVFAVVRLLISNIVNVDAIKTRNSAVFLAKEWMDIVYNIKDSNIAKGLKRDCVLRDSVNLNASLIWNVDDVCKYFFSSGINDNKVFQVWFDPEGYFFVQSMDDWTFDENLQKSKLYYYSGQIGWRQLSRYAYSGLTYHSTDTKFSRYIKIKPILEEWKVLPMEKIVKIESHVLYKNWTKTGDIVLESFISAY